MFATPNTTNNTSDKKLKLRQNFAIQSELCQLSIILGEEIAEDEFECGRVELDRVTYIKTRNGHCDYE